MEMSAVGLMSLGGLFVPGVGWLLGSLYSQLLSLKFKMTLNIYPLFII